jgi:hypothetical protein
MVPPRHPSGIDRAIESKLALLVARFGVPLLLAIIGYYARGSLLELQAGQADQGRDMAQIKSDVRDLNTRLDTGVIRQVNGNTLRLNGLESRVQTLERRSPP